MILDVLALQALYGKNMQSHSGNSIHKYVADGAYSTLWDASGIDEINFENSSYDWDIVLPWYQWTSSDELGGHAVTYTNTNADYPTDLIWLLGNIENAKGGAGNDRIFGNLLNNILSGGEGNDKIEGWEGNDTLIGGSGSDTFYFSYGWGIDTVIDFNASEDNIVILDRDFNNLDLSQVAKESDGNGFLTYVLDQDSKIILNGIKFSDDTSVSVSNTPLGSSEEIDKETQTNSNTQSIPEETEPNNSIQNATNLSSGSSISGQLYSTSDDDYYKISVNDASTITIAFDSENSTNSNSINYFQATLLSSYGTVLATKKSGQDFSLICRYLRKW